MTNRREFLRTSVAVSALPLTMQELIAPRRAPATRGVSSIRQAVVDGRYAEARRFAHELGEYGVPAVGLDDGDITRIYRDLASRAAFAVGGMTQFGPLLVAEQLARDRGLRVILRIAHIPRAGGVAHAIAASAPTIALAEELAQQPPHWPALASGLAAHALAGPIVRRVLVTPSAAPEPLVLASDASYDSFIHYYMPHAIREGQAAPLDGPLFTWVIAPAH